MALQRCNTHPDDNLRKDGTRSIGAKTQNSRQTKNRKESGNISKISVKSGKVSKSTNSLNGQKRLLKDRLNHQKAKTQTKTLTPSAVSDSANDEACSSISDTQGVTQTGIVDIGDMFSDAASQSISDVKSIKPDETMQVQIKYSGHLYREQKIALSCPRVFLKSDSEELFALYLKL